MNPQATQLPLERVLATFFFCCCRCPHSPHLLRLKDKAARLPFSSSVLASFFFFALVSPDLSPSVSEPSLCLTDSLQVVSHSTASPQPSAPASRDPPHPQPPPEAQAVKPQMKRSPLSPRFGGATRTPCVEINKGLL